MVRTIPIQKRAKYFFQRYRAATLLVVEVHHDTVIEQIDGIDKTFDDLFLKGNVRRVAAGEPEHTAIYECSGISIQIYGVEL